MEKKKGEVIAKARVKGKEGIIKFLKEQGIIISSIKCVEKDK